MADPSSLVPPPLVSQEDHNIQRVGRTKRMQLRHIHLIANHAFPKLPQFNLDLLVEYLIQAPRIVKEQASMNWMFLQGPQDGDVFLVWQPPQMGVREASDGYVWADPESAFSSEMRGYVCLRKLCRIALTWLIFANHRKWKCTCTRPDSVCPMNQLQHMLGAGFA